MLLAHHTAAKTRLQAHAILADKVEDALRLTAGNEVVRQNHVVLSTMIPGYLDDRLTSEQTPDGDADLILGIRAVAVDFAGALKLIDAVSAQLVGHRLVVPGRNVSALARTELEPADYDRVARMHFVDSVFEATTSRA